MKNLKSYVTKEVKKRTESPAFAKEVIERVMLNIEKNLELGNIKMVDEKIVDEIIFQVFDLYY
jgi:hypothetical protein